MKNVLLASPESEERPPSFLPGHVRRRSDCPRTVIGILVLLRKSTRNLISILKQNDGLKCLEVINVQRICVDWTMDMSNGNEKIALLHCFTLNRVVNLTRDQAAENIS